MAMQNRFRRQGQRLRTVSKACCRYKAIRAVILDAKRVLRRVERAERAERRRGHGEQKNVKVDVVVFVGQLSHVAVQRCASTL